MAVLLIDSKDTSKGVGSMEQTLHELAKRGNTLDLVTMIEKGQEINAVDEKGRTAVMAATYANQPDAVAVLIEHGANINIQDDLLNTPFLYAGAEGLMEITRLTLEAGADQTITNRYGGNALIPASEKGHVEMVEFLLNHADQNVNHINNLGWTALLEAIILTDGSETYQEIVSLLIQHDADVNLADKDGVTPLQHAKSKGYKEMEALLAKEGAY
jgi:ankyrin repeat protein